ncbi:hypothetical protein BCON_0393g00010 [Botryotinia convoluta]|uniref:DUF6590 domain-containing protein n=1 Tax=Botryotinia convoluta TaxID=54673 RepID=A0A4Z1H9F7_9HELO|nr:hypothetical protein BCON_0393g00010 [Botryotinia convoluta]
MSSHSSHIREPKTSSNPALWSDWEWNAEKKMWESYRTISRGRIEWKFEHDQSISSANTDIPRLDNAMLLGDVSENTSQYSKNKAYALESSDIDTVTKSLAPATLTSFVDPDPPIVGNLGKDNTSMQHRNFGSILWSEPSGSLSGGGTFSSHGKEHGEMIYAQVRRFVVIDYRQGHCLCLPIMTYRGRATSQPGVHAEEHAIIYTTEPKLAPNEHSSQMIFQPIKMIPDSAQHHLDLASRINYAKTYTVEYNVKVWFIGKIDQDSEQTLRESYDQTHPPLSLSTRSSVPSSYSTNNPTHSDSTSTIPNTLDTPSLSTLSYYPTASGYGNGIPSSISSGETECGISYFNSNQYGGYSSERQSPPTQYSSPFVDHLSTNFDNHNPTIGLASHFPDYQHSVKNPPPTIPLGGSHFQSTYNQQTSALVDPERQELVDPERAVSIYGGSNTSHSHSHGRSRNDIKDRSSRQTSPFPIYGDRSNGDSSLDPHSILRGSADEFVPTSADPSGEKTQDSVGLQDNQDFTNLTFKHLRRSGSSSSLESLESLFSSTSSLSSLSSTGSRMMDAENRLVRILSKDDELKILYQEALEITTLGKFEENFRRCIKQLSKHLRAEVPQMSTVARHISRGSHYAASKIRADLEHQEVTQILPPKNLLMGDIKEPASFEDDEEDAEDDANEDRIAQQFETFEITVQQSRSWQLLRENLRLFLHPNNVQRALFDTWPILQSREIAYEIKYSIDWEVPQLLKSFFPEGQSIGDILTLTSDSIGSIALSVRDYLSKTWKAIECDLIKVIDIYLASNDEICVAKHQSSELTLTLRSSCRTGANNATSIDISALAKYDTHQTLISAMSWLCSALRISNQDDLCQSSVLVKNIWDTDRTKPFTSENERFDIILILNDLCPFPKNKGDSGCWYILFPRMVVAQGFPVKQRSHGRGLEISFPDMALVTGCLSLVMFDGGLVANGLNSVLFPVEELLEDNAIQWHYCPKTVQGLRFRKSTFEIMEKTGKWYKESNTIRLINRRCFLGWVPEASILIGTGKYPVANREWSTAAKVPDNRQIKSYSLTFGTGGTGLITATGSLGWTTSSMPSTITSKTEKDIHEVLKDGENDTILMYDSERQIAWYLPKSCVVLYLAHARITHLGWQVVRGSEITHLKLAKPGSGGLEANNALISNLQLQLKKADSKSINGYRLESLGGFVKAIWQALDDIGTGLRSVQKEFSRAQEGPPKYIYGVEYMDTVDMREEKETKRVAISQPWAYLTKDYPATIFCGALEHPIVPDRPELICQAWQIVPPGKDHLVVTSSVVQHFLRKAREGLCERVEWRFDGKLIDNHRLDKQGAVHHVQRLFTTSSPQPNHSLLELLAEVPNGSFIFTQSKLSKGCSESIPSHAVTQMSGCDDQNRRIQLNSTTEPAGKYAEDVLRHGNGLYSLGKQMVVSSNLSTSARHNNLIENHGVNSPLIRYPIVIPRSSFHMSNEKGCYKTLNGVNSSTTDIRPNASCSNDNFAEALPNRSSLISREICRNSNGQSVANSSQDSKKIIRKAEKADLRNRYNIIESDSGNE